MGLKAVCFYFLNTWVMQPADANISHCFDAVLAGCETTSNTSGVESEAEKCGK